jgi:hypothetical protein
VKPLDVQTALATAPLADAMRALILTDPRLRAYEFTSAARTADDPDLFFGTSGLGLVRLDAAMGQWEPLGYSLLGVGADALAVGPGGVWVVQAPRFGGRGGITWLPEDLSSTTPLEPPPGHELGPVVVHRMVAAAGALWIASDAGVFRVDPDRGRARRFTLGDGLPSEDVRALAPAPDGVWIGTTRGLAVITADNRVVRIGGFALVQSFSRCARRCGSAAWPVSACCPVPQGRRALRTAAEPARARSSPSRARDTLVAVLEDQVAGAIRAGRWTVTRPRAALGRLTTAAGDVGGVWLGGQIGLAWWSVARHVQGLAIPGDVGAAVRRSDPPWVWVASIAASCGCGATRW